MKRMSHLAALPLAAVTFLAVPGCRPGSTVATPQAAPQLRATIYGAVEGVNDQAASGTWWWKGIPFAKPPVGGLRWHAPVEPDAWVGVRQARAFGEASVQAGRIYGPGLHNTYDATIGTSLNEAVGSEDGLYLNIWRPATAETGLPVVFFIHGGSNVSGYTADPVYDGAALARTARVVVVTASYRVGVFGWLDLPQLKSDNDALGASGNFGTLDQIQALQFVQRNIARFGGDAANVTLMGQSAGAVDAYALLTSPLVLKAKPQLFHKAILMSGGFALPTDLPAGCIPTLKPASYTRAQGQKLLNGLLIADGKATDDAGAVALAGTWTPEATAAYLRTQTPGAVLKQVQTRLAPAGLAGAFHVPDGAVVAANPVAAIRAGQYLKVPIIISNTREETKLFASFLALSPALGGKPGLRVDDRTRLGMMMAFKGDEPQTLTVQDLIAPAYLPADQPETGYDARLAKLNALFFVANRDAMLQALGSQQQLWVSQFNWKREPAPWNVVYGSAHAFDLPFVFGNFGPSLFSGAVNSQANRDGRLALSQAMMGSVGAFARKGDPNHPGLSVNWPVWPKRLTLDATLTAADLSVQEASAP